LAPSSISSSASRIAAEPIVNPVPVITPVDVMAPEPIVPAAVKLAPLNVNAVVVPDLIIKSPLVFVAEPNVVPSSLKKISPPPASSTISVPASILARAEADIVRSVPSPSIFSPSSPNVMPTSVGIFMSDVAVKLISAPEVIVRSVLSPQSFHLYQK